MIPEDLLEILRCIECLGRVAVQGGELVCQQCATRYPIEDGVPVMLRESARRPESG